MPTPETAADDLFADYLWGRRMDLKLRALCNRLYQQDRWRIHEMREGAVKAASLLAGSVALARVLDQTTLQICLAIIFSGTAMSLVFGWSGKARDAARRAAEWSGLDHDIDAAGEHGFTEAQIDAWAARANKIESGEPAMHPGLHERAYLRACASLGMTPKTAPTRWQQHRPAIIIP